MTHLKTFLETITYSFLSQNIHILSTEGFSCELFAFSGKFLYKASTVLLST